MAQLEIMQRPTADDCSYSIDSPIRFSTNFNEYYDDGLAVFLEVRRNLFGMAYRMLKNSAEAEDIVQEVWLRWQATNRSAVLNPPAFLMETTIRMCINVCRSARARRETYVGEWFSEPIDVSADPGLATARAEALRSAILILLERLRPAERAAYILREAFNYSCRKIAGVLRIKEPNVRQLLTRARRHIAERRRVPVNPTEQQRLLVAFIDAAQNGNLAALEDLFAPEIVCPSSEVQRKTMNRSFTANLERAPLHNLSSCHETMGCSIFASSCCTREDFGRNSNYQHGNATVSSIGCLPQDQFVRTLDVVVSEAAAPVPLKCYDDSDQYSIRGTSHEWRLGR